MVSAHQCWPAIFKHHACLITRIERACKPDSPVKIENMELLLNQHRRPVNDVSFDSRGRFCVTLASHFSRGENFGHTAMVKIQFDAVPHVSLFLVL